MFAAFIDEDSTVSGRGPLGSGRVCSVDDPAHSR